VILPKLGVSKKLNISRNTQNKSVLDIKPEVNRSFITIEKPKDKKLIQDYSTLELG